ncbi:Dam family site-specific DNA-(adenine-N6)-methyltransferase [uncultured Phocaeicola sp.]|uniref:Dam family site-specific DNA-(adenine-N6)-methyltransferase n=1 Tax=uncultured Phocaeicola sp. TaxID=990718 RepID=UPI0025E7EFE7|nr:Dam family site-specific DNA-(adenine-N6)-methyltransferase [uncultured Phocaeicola sp.]
MKNGIARSPLFYVGDKYKLIREIKTHFPNNINRFIEPFVGGGSVMMNVDANCFILNDINGFVIAIHQMLCEYLENPSAFYDRFFELVDQYGLSLSFRGHTAPNELKKMFPKTYYAKYNKDAYNRLKDNFNREGKQDMMKLYMLLIYGFNRMLRFNGKGDFNIPVGDVDFNQNTYDALDDYFSILKNKQIEWHNEDFRVFLNNIDFEEGDLIYLDPPYLITFSEYNKLWSEQTENDLLTLLDDLSDQGVHFAISNITHYKGKVNKTFLDWSIRYNSYPIKSNYISFNDNTIKNFNEVLVTNY